MATNLAIDDRLVNKAKRLGRHKTKRDAVNQALAEYVRRHELGKLFDLFGTVEYLPDYDYKASRRRSTREGADRHFRPVSGPAPAPSGPGGRGRRAAA